MRKSHILSPYILPVLAILLGLLLVQPTHAQGFGNRFQQRPGFTPNNPVFIPNVSRPRQPYHPILDPRLYAALGQPMPISGDPYVLGPNAFNPYANAYLYNQLYWNYRPIVSRYGYYGNPWMFGANPWNNPGARFWGMNNPFAVNPAAANPFVPWNGQVPNNGGFAQQQFFNNNRGFNANPRVADLLKQN